MSPIPLPYERRPGRRAQPSGACILRAPRTVWPLMLSALFACSTGPLPRATSADCAGFLLRHTDCIPGDEEALLLECEAIWQYNYDSDCAQLLEWNYGFPSSHALNVPGFDSLNRPYTRGRFEDGDLIPFTVYTMRDGEWQALSFLGALQSHYVAKWSLPPEDIDTLNLAAMDGAGTLPAAIVFDSYDRAYTMLAVKADAHDHAQEVRFLLLYSTDYCTSWQVYELDYVYDATRSENSFLIETPYSPEPLKRPPAILLYQQCWDEEHQVDCDCCEEDNNPDAHDLCGRYGTLELFIPAAPAGSALPIVSPAPPGGFNVLAGTKLQLSTNCIGIAAQSGAANMVLTDVGQQTRTYVAWVELVNPPPEDCQTNSGPCPLEACLCSCANYDSATYIAVYDHTTGLGPATCLTAPPGADPHSYTTKAHPQPTNDTHAMPGIVMDGAGYLDVVTGAHIRPLYHLRSENPRDASAWGDAVSNCAFVAQGTNYCELYAEHKYEYAPCTYLSLVRDAERVHLVFRRNTITEEDSSGIGCDLVYQSWSDGSWHDVVTLFSPTNKWYVNYFQRLSMDRKANLYVSYSFYQKPWPTECPKPDGWSVAPHQVRAITTSNDGGASWQLVTADDFRKGLIGVWVDCNVPPGGDGTYDDPFQTLSQGLDSVANGQGIWVKTGTCPFSGTITKNVTLSATFGDVTIGAN